jgi:DNA topoisomerase-2
VSSLFSRTVFLCFREKNLISIWNNGQGIPVVEHKDEKMYVPTMIFGHLLTSSNYNDEEEKVTGGRNGYGAKLCNIFSTMFTVETTSKEYKRSFKQVNNYIVFLNVEKSYMF